MDWATRENPRHRNRRPLRADQSLPPRSRPKRRHLASLLHRVRRPRRHWRRTRRHDRRHLRCLRRPIHPCDRPVWDPVARLPALPKSKTSSDSPAASPALNWPCAPSSKCLNSVRSWPPRSASRASPPAKTATITTSNSTAATNLRARTILIAAGVAWRKLAAHSRAAAPRGKLPPCRSRPASIITVADGLFAYLDLMFAAEGVAPWQTPSNRAN